LTLTTLDLAVADHPDYSNWPSVIKTPSGHYRSAYSIVPVLAAAEHDRVPLGRPQEFPNEQTPRVANRGCRARVRRR
jgi:hypothetical protein